MSKRTGTEEYNFMKWLDALVDEEPEAVAAERVEGFKIRLADTLRDARSAAGMSQNMVSEISGLKQSVISRLERPDHNPTLESIVRYLNAIGADLVLNVISNDQTFHATEAGQRSVTVPPPVVREAAKRGLTVREYVLSCIEANRATEEMRESLQDAIRAEIRQQL